MKLESSFGTPTKPSLNAEFTSQWQPTLNGRLIALRPMNQDDFEALYDAASDPLIWEQHPDRERHTRERFKIFFSSGIESRGALVVIDQKTNRIIGSSRYFDFDPVNSLIEVGYTFLTRNCWGNGFNQELKSLMLWHAFRSVENVLFLVNETNFRSQRAVLKLGAKEIDRVIKARTLGVPRVSIVYRLTRNEWQNFSSNCDKNAECNSSDLRP